MSGEWPLRTAIGIAGLALLVNVALFLAPVQVEPQEGSLVLTAVEDLEPEAAPDFVWGLAVGSGLTGLVLLAPGFGAAGMRFHK